MIEYLQIFAEIVGAASIIVFGLEKIAKITPTTKDDKYVGSVKKVLSKVSGVLSRLALNPK